MSKSKDCQSTSTEDKSGIVTDYESLFKGMAQGVIFLNSKGEITSANPAAERILGVTFDQMQGRTNTVRTWKIFHEDGSDFPSDTHPSAVARNTGKPVRNVIMGIFNPERGKTSWIEASAVPLFRDNELTPHQVYSTFDDITELFETREELRKTNEELEVRMDERTSELVISEHRFRAMFENSDVSIWNEDLSGIYTALENLRLQGVSDLNEHLETNKNLLLEISGMVRVLAVNEATLRLFEADSEADFIEWMQKSMASGISKIFRDGVFAIWNKEEVFRSERTYKTLKGKELVVIVSFKVPETIDGFSNVPLCIFDISERKTAELALIESEERLRESQAVAHLGHFSADFKTGLWETSPELDNIVGIDEGFERNFSNWKKIVHPDFREAMVEEMVENTFTRHQDYDQQYKIINHKSGAERWVHCLGSVQLDDNGQAVGLFGTAQDITDRKNDEEQLLRLSQAVEQSPVTIVMTDLNGDIEYANPAFEQTTGYRVAEAIGKKPSILKSGETPDEQYQILWGRISSGKSWKGEFHNRRKDGSLYWESAFISPVTTSDGSITGYLAIKEEISEQKHLAEQARRLQKMEAIGELTGGIAHDFNNILGIVQGNLELVQRLKKDDKKLLRFLENAISGVRRGTDLTSKLLNFSGRTAGGKSLTSVNELIQNLEELISRSLTASINVETRLEKNLWTVETDTGDFEDALLNLSLNARDAMPDGGDLFIETSNKVLKKSQIPGRPDNGSNEFVHLSVRDTGIGMNEAVLDQAFDPFYTTKEKGKGTGLGLSMVYGFVQRSGGHLEIDSKPGQGCTFNIFLPRAEGEMETNTAPEQSQTPARGSEKILVVDDKEPLREITVHLLEELGYRTLSVADANEALKALQNNPDIDLMLSDIIMPGGMDGFQLAEKSHDKYPELRIVLSSGYTKGREKQLNSDNNYISDIASKVLGKPYSRAELAAAVRRGLEN